MKQRELVLGCGKMGLAMEHLLAEQHEDSHHHTLRRQLVRGEWSPTAGEGVQTLQMVEKLHLIPLSALSTS